MNGSVGKNHELFGTTEADESPIRETRILFRNAMLPPVGGIKVCGFVRDGEGVRQTRAYGMYGLAYFVYGKARYWEPGRAGRPLRPGDLITFFPEIPNKYGPVPGGRWDEFYIVFEGPLAEAWRSAGVLDPSRPIRHLEPVDYWLHRFIATAGSGNDGDMRKAYDEAVRLHALLAEIALANDVRTAGDREWLKRAKAAMALHFDDHEAAQSMGTSYETFRKRFVRLTRLSPGRYRLSQVIDEARRLLVSGHTVREVAHHLRFCDEFHFSRQFKKIAGISPSKLRR